MLHSSAYGIVPGLIRVYRLNVYSPSPIHLYDAKSNASHVDTVDRSIGIIGTISDLW